MTDEHLIFVRDEARHLVCLPYSIEGLHEMAFELGIKRCWFHAGRLAHYDVPLKDVVRLRLHPRVRFVSNRTVLGIIKGEVTSLE